MLKQTNLVQLMTSEQEHCLNKDSELSVFASVLTKQNNNQPTIQILVSSRLNDETKAFPIIKTI